MSHENVEFVRQGLTDVDAFWALFDDQIVFETHNYPTLSVDADAEYVGREAVIRACRHYWGTFVDYRLEAEELIDAGSSVVVVAFETGRGKGSGVPVERRYAQVWTFRRGRIIRWEMFPDRAAALEAVGRREQTD